MSQVRHVHGAPCFVSVRCEPAAALRDVVLGYSGFIEVHGHPVTRIALPTPRVKLNFSFGSVLRVTSSEHDGTYQSFVARPTDRAVECTHQGFRHRINAILTPLGACRLLGIPLGELPPYVAAGGALGELAHQIHEQLAAAVSWRERFEILDRALLHRLEQPSALEQDIGARALVRLEQTGGALAISDIANELGCTRKHVHERVVAMTGMCPKMFATLLRFDRVVRAIRTTTPGSLAELARGAGYYDQSHLHRDVRRFAGTAPRDLWRELVAAVPGRFVEPI